MSISLAEENFIVTKIDEKLDNVEGKKSSAADSLEEEKAFEAKKVESLKLVAEEEISNADNSSNADSKLELPLNTEEKEDGEVDDFPEDGEITGLLEKENSVVLLEKEDSVVLLEEENTVLVEEKVEEVVESEEKINEDKTEEEEKKVNEEEKEEKQDNVYEVEKIVGHRLYKGNVTRYEIKWKGYSAEDNTLERAAVIHADVPELCIEYWNSINITRPYNAPEQATAVKVEVSNDEQEENKKKRKFSEEDATDKSNKKSKKNKSNAPKYMKNYKLPTDYPNDETDWNQEINKFCVQASPNDSGIIQAYIQWNNGKKTIHDLKTLHEKIPEKLFAYYEERLHFV